MGKKRGVKMLLKSIPELQIELNDLKRKGCSPEELASWVHSQENPFEFRTNVLLFFMNESSPKSFSLILSKNLSRSDSATALFCLYRNAKFESNITSEDGLKYANFIKDLLGYEFISTVSACIYPKGTSPYFANDSTIQEFYAKYLLS